MSQIELTFLGTSCMVPTKERNVSGIFLSYKNKGILIDCGEGTQRQMNIAGINRNKVTHILLTHWHGDHVSGLIGLIQTLGNQNALNAEPPLINIYGPKETEQRIEHMLQTCIFDNKLRMQIHEIIPKKDDVLRILDNEDFYIEASLMDHGVPCLGYRFVEKDIRKIDTARTAQLGIKDGPLIGKLQRGEPIFIGQKEIFPDLVSHVKKGLKITIILDTAVCNNALTIAQDADLLICEASYANDLDEKAENNKHMTAKNAALLANNANVSRLIVTHISQRYKSSQEVLQDAKDLFSNVEVAYDFMKVRL